MTIEKLVGFELRLSDVTNRVQALESSLGNTQQLAVAGAIAAYEGVVPPAIAGLITEISATYGVEEPTRGAASGGEGSIPTPAPVPLDKPYWVDLFINGVLQTPGVHFSTDGSPTVFLINFTLSAGDVWLVRQYQRSPA